MSSAFRDANMASRDAPEPAETPPLALSIVIPAYNESARLPRTLAALRSAIDEGALAPLAVEEVIVVDDGSTDDTLRSIEAVLEGPWTTRVHRFEQNRGKGAAVRAGLALATRPWILFADADLATPWQEALLLAREAAGDARIVIGSRGLRASQLERRQHPLRELLGKSFNRLIVLVTGLPFKDTQCGFKLIHKASVEATLASLSVDRFAWDFEFLFAAHKAGVVIREVPIRWSHQDGSKIRPVWDGLTMLRDLGRVKLRGVREARR